MAKVSKSKPLTTTELDFAQSELEKAIAGESKLSPEVAYVLRKTIASARTSLLDKADHDQQRVVLWHEIEAAWPQLAEAMLSRLTELLWRKDIPVRESKPVPIAEEDIATLNHRTRGHRS